MRPLPSLQRNNLVTLNSSDWSGITDCGQCDDGCSCSRWDHNEKNAKNWTTKVISKFQGRWTHSMSATPLILILILTLLSDLAAQRRRLPPKFTALALHCRPNAIYSCDATTIDAQKRDVCDACVNGRSVLNSKKSNNNNSRDDAASLAATNNWNLMAKNDAVAEDDFCVCEQVVCVDCIGWMVIWWYSVWTCQWHACDT